MLNGSMSHDSFWQLVESVHRAGQVIVWVDDIDLTVSTGGKKGFNDPRLTGIYPRSAASLQAQAKAGHEVCFLTNRSGEQVERMLKDAGIGDALVVGSYGYELRMIHTKSPAQSQSTILSPYPQHASFITWVLQNMLMEFCDHLGADWTMLSGCEVELPTSDGPIILERKGGQYPQGIAHVYNFNLVDPEVRVPLIEALTGTYWRLVNEERARIGTETLEIEDFWGLSVDAHPELPGRISLKVEPRSPRGKGDGMRTVLKEVSRKTRKPIGLVVMADDSNVGAGAIHEARSLGIHAGFQTVGVWVNPGTEQREMAEASAVHVDGVEGYAQLLELMAKAISY